jgi:hypothetical protein
MSDMHLQTPHVREPGTVSPATEYFRAAIVGGTAKQGRVEASVRMLYYRHTKVCNNQFVNLHIAQ